MELRSSHDELRDIVERQPGDITIDRIFAVRLCVEHDATRLLGAAGISVDAAKLSEELARVREANRALLERHCAVIEAVQTVLEPLAHGRLVDIDAVLQLLDIIDPDDDDE